MKKMKLMNKKGITLIALIITIIVLLILAGITIGMLASDSGILKRAVSTKTETEIGEEKEIINLASSEMASKETIEDRNRLNHDEMETIVGNNARGLTFELLDDDDGYIVEFTQRKRYYKIHDNGETEEVEVVKDSDPGDITKDKNGVLLTGTEENPYEIWNIEDLIEFTKTINSTNSYYEGKTIKLMKNLDFKSNLSYNNPKTTKYDTHLGGDGTTELKTQLSEEGLGYKLVERSNGFKGIFDGQNYKISNLYVKLETGYSYALFCGNNYGTIKRINFSNVNFTTNSMAGIVCASNFGTIEDIKVSGEIICGNQSAGGYSFGGICGWNESTIRRVHNSADIKGGVSLNYGGIGGICYENRSTIEQCTNYGKIFNAKRIGGIASNNTGTIKQCINIGKVESREDGSGLAHSNSGTIEYCYNIGDIGIEGQSYSTMNGISKTNSESGIISGCYSTGVIYGGTRGGIVYNNQGLIKNTYYIRKDNYDLQSSSSTGIVETSGEKTESQMLNDAFLNDLNAGLTDENKVFVKDTNNINSGYPILKWQAETN